MVFPLSLLGSSGVNGGKPLSTGRYFPFSSGLYKLPSPSKTFGGKFGCGSSSSRSSGSPRPFKITSRPLGVVKIRSPFSLLLSAIPSGIIIVSLSLKLETVSFPGPLPVIIVSSSLSLPGFIVLLPPLPLKISLPVPPSKVSLPDPPVIRSSPAPPLAVLLPSPVSIISFPPPVEILSSPLPAVTLSCASPPT